MIKKERVKGALNQLIDSKYSELSVGDRFDRTALERVAYDVADAAIVVYREKIAAGLRRAGLEFADDETLTTDKILDAVKAKTGIDLRSFDIEEIKEKALFELSSDISERVGFDIDLKNGLENGLDAAVDAAIARGGSVLASASIKGKLRLLAIAQRAGVSLEDVKKVSDAIKQKNYRKNAARPVWVAR